MEGLLTLAVLLACPLMMYFCMRGMMGRTEGQHASCGPVSRKSNEVVEIGLAEKMSELETQQLALHNQISAVQSALQKALLLEQKVTELAFQQQQLLDQMIILQNTVQRLWNGEGTHERLNGGAPRAELPATPSALTQIGEHKEV